MAGLTAPAHQQDRETDEPPELDGASAEDLPHLTAGPSVDGRARAGEARLHQLLDAGGPQVVYQPQLSLSRLTVTGYEALSRFPHHPYSGTEHWFGLARTVGLGPALEAAALRRAFEGAQDRPAGVTLAVNLSPGVLTGPGLSGPLLSGVLPDDLTGIEIELTEQADQPGAGDRLRRAIDALRARGATIAIDDVGIAHSGLRRVIELEPDRLKIDRHLVQGVARRPAKAALIRTIVELAAQLGAEVCAEGVESVEDLTALAELQVDLAQGWLIGGPRAQFEPARPSAVRTACASLTAMLGAPAGEHGGDLATRLAAARTVEELGELAAAEAARLGADTVVLSPVTGAGTAVTDLGAARDGGSGEWVRLADCGATRRCLAERRVMPVHTEEGAALLVPVVSRGVSVALLTCLRRTDSVWSRREIAQARDLAARLGPTFELLALAPRARRKPTPRPAPTSPETAPILVSPPTVPMPALIRS
ncbi:EAL domain-containing protein [Spongisporangium articulatum]|uniref:EAL domain-containing protein n=1 Tax=Spongisporangium articulatum TaxID=3362603 RepID=A0ABW8AMU6_9ACTN